MADNFTHMKPLRHEKMRINKLNLNSKTEMIFHVSFTRYSKKMFTHVLQSKLQDISKSLKWTIEFGQLITWLMKVVETSFQKHCIRHDLLNL
jgi:hypothetical protein